MEMRMSMIHMYIKNLLQASGIYLTTVKTSQKRLVRHQMNRRLTRLQAVIDQGGWVCVARAHCIDIFRRDQVPSVDNRMRIKYDMTPHNHGLLN